MPTIPDLYLAFRQAKTALYFERRGVGLLELAAFEQDLPNKLRELKQTLDTRPWFDGLEVGEVWIVPKRLRDGKDSDDVVRIGARDEKGLPRAIDVQVRISPSPGYAIAEVLYLWQFGGVLETMLSGRDVLGYRLDLRAQRVIPHRRWLFEYWPSRYQQFRTAPLQAAKNALARDEEVLIVSADLASYYDTIDPSFLLSEPFIEDLLNNSVAPIDVDEYRKATTSLLGAYARYRAIASRRVGTRLETGVPIGALTSRVVANLALAPLDRHIGRRPDVLCYRRYVDDIVIVAQARDSAPESLRRFFPLLEERDGILPLDTELLERQGSEFQIQQKKVRIHRLGGIQGVDFVDAVISDFQRTLSESRSFVDEATLSRNRNEEAVLHAGISTGLIWKPRAAARRLSAAMDRWRCCSS